MNVDLNLIGDICRNYVELSLYILGDIPGKKLENAIQYFPLTDTEMVIALYDSTTFGNGKKGIAICDNGVFYKTEWTRNPRYKYFSWEEFANLDIYGEDLDICFGNEYKFFDTQSIKVKEVIVELLKKVQKSLFNEDQLENVEEIQGGLKNGDMLNIDSKWMIAIDGNQYGPMNDDEIKKNLINNFFNPETTYAWKQGMNNWELLENIPKFTDMKEEIKIKTTLPHLQNVPSAEKSEVSLVDEKIDINNCEIEDLFIFDCMDLEKIILFMKIRKGGKNFNTAEEMGDFFKLKPHEVKELNDKATFNLSKNLKRVRKIEF